jgi:hypothetical protein
LIRLSWITGAYVSVASILGLSFLRETYAPVIQLRRIKRIPDSEKAARDHQEVFERQTGFLMIWLNLSRPFILLFKSYVCFILSLYMAL